MRLAIALVLILFGSLPAHCIDEGGRDNHGEQVTVDLPDELHLKNVGGSDGAGLCVFCSIDHAARYQDTQALVGFRDFMRKYPGGGYPEKVAKMLPMMAASKGLPTPDYVQHTGGDAEFLKLALRTGRYVSITYDGRDGVFYRGPIAHMVNLVHLSDQWAVIHDNNYPGKYLWMTPTELLSRWRGSGGGWAVVLLNPPPPPIPTSRPQPQHRALAREDQMNALIMTMLLTAVPGQWGTQSCPDGNCAPVRSAPTYHGWYDVGGGKLELYWRGEKAGTLDPVTGKWQTSGKPAPIDLIQTFGLAKPAERKVKEPATMFDALNQWNPCDCFECNCGQCLCERQFVAMADEEGIKNYGLDVNRIPQTVGYDCSGRQCSKSQAFQALTAGGLVDDRDKGFLTIVGDESLRRSVLKDLDTSAALRGWRDKLHVAAYPSDHWAVKQVGLAPGITFQRASDTGKAPVEWRFRAYAGDVALAEALRKSDPNYRPDADPDPLAKPKPPAPDPGPVNPPVAPNAPAMPVPWHLVGVLLLGAAMVAGAYLLGKRK